MTERKQRAKVEADSRRKWQNEKQELEYRGLSTTPREKKCAAPVEMTDVD
jgi:hypothetical protein